MNSVRTAVLLMLLSTQALAQDGLQKTAGQGYNPFANAMDMMMDAMDRYARKRSWDDALSSYSTQAQPWSWGGMPGMTPQMPGQSQMQQMSDLKNEIATLQQQIQTADQQKTDLQKQIADKKAQIKKLESNEQLLQQRLQSQPDTTNTK